MSAQRTIRHFPTGAGIIDTLGLAAICAVKIGFVLAALAWGIEDYAAALDAKTLKISTDVWLPYEDLSNTDSPGFSTEVITRVMRDMDVSIEIREFPWARGLADVFEGRRDALYTAFRTEERAEHCYYPDEPLASERWVFFVRTEQADELSFSSLDEIKGRRIGILRGASVTEEFWSFLREYADYEEVETDDLNFKKLSKGRLDYVVTSYSNGTLLLKELGLSETIEPLSLPVIKEDDLFIIFSRATVEQEFVERFSAALRAFKTTSDYQAIHEKYFGPTGM
jgi:polar amino acid transport system substrate-binding protein